MKRIILSIFTILVLTGTFAYAKDTEPQAFNVTISIKYTDKTLKQIAEIENKIRNLFHECDGISIEFDKKQDGYRTIYPLYSIPINLPDVTTVPGTLITPN